MHLSDDDRKAIEAAQSLLARYLEDPDAPPPPSLPPDLRQPAPPTNDRERRVLQLLNGASGRGVRAIDIADGIGYRPTNVYRMLASMRATGLVEQVPGSRPLRWRLTLARRSALDAAARLADHVATGEWTTCADISLAHRGDTAAAALVCWAAAHLDGFPAAHRVLLDGGRPHPADHEHRRLRPGVLREQLSAEGLRFDAFGRADRGARVGWDELKRRQLSGRR